MLQQVEKQSYLRNGIDGLVILFQDHMTKKMAAYRLALRELSYKACATLHPLKMTSHSLRVAPCSSFLAKL